MHKKASPRLLKHTLGFLKELLDSANALTLLICGPLIAITINTYFRDEIPLDICKQYIGFCLILILFVRFFVYFAKTKIDNSIEAHLLKKQ